MLVDLVRKIDAFVAKYGGQNQEKFKADLMEVVEEAVGHGEGKDQGKIVGIASKLIKGFFGKKED
jgi:hypothetical protein